MKITKRSKQYEYILIWVSFVMLSCISVLIFSYLNFHKLYSAYDLQFHLKRMMELKESINHGNLFPIFNFNYFHGSAVTGMYPYLSLYPFVFINTIIHSIITSYYVFIAFIVLVSLLISFYGSLRFSRSIVISYIFAITYSISSTFIFLAFIIGDLGILTSLAFLPLVIFGFIDLMNGSGNYCKFSLGLSLMVYCQVPSVISTILILFIYFICNVKHVNISIVVNFIKSGILSVLLTSIVWIPLFHIIVFNHIYTVSSNQFTSAGIKSYIMLMGIIPLITSILALIFYKTFSNTLKKIYLLSILVIILSSKVIPWPFITSFPILRVLDNLQSASRFLIIPGIILCYVFSDIVYKCFRNYKLLFCFIVLCIILLQISSQMFILYKKSFSDKDVNFNNFRIVKYYSLHYAGKMDYSSISNNNQSIKYFVNGYFRNNDYFPYRSLKYKNNIYNNYLLYDNSYLSLNHIGYNKFAFNIKNIKNQKLQLPFVAYNNEFIHLYINHRRVKYFINNNGTINVNHFYNKNHNILFIKSASRSGFINIFKSVLFCIGILWCNLLFYLYKVKNTNHVKINR